MTKVTIPDGEGFEVHELFPGKFFRRIPNQGNGLVRWEHFRESSGEMGDRDTWVPADRVLGWGDTRVLDRMALLLTQRDDLERRLADLVEGLEGVTLAGALPARLEKAIATLAAVKAERV